MATVTRALLVVCVLLVGMQHAASEIALVLLSDSLTDNGSHGVGSLLASNLTARENALSQTFSSSWNGRFSNGFNWNDYLVGYPFSRLYNYAQGGASACANSGDQAFSGANAGAPAGLPAGASMPPMGNMGMGRPSGGTFSSPLPLGNQTMQYLTEGGQDELDSDGIERVVLVWIGGNDMNSAVGQDAETVNTTLDGVVGCIEDSLRLLLDSGESRVAVGMPTFYSLGVEAAAGDVDSYLSVMDMAEDKMLVMLDSVMEEYPKAIIKVWDVAGAVKNLTLADPPAYGFTNNTAACLASSGIPSGRKLQTGGAITTSMAYDSTSISNMTVSDAVAASVQALQAQAPVGGIITATYCTSPDTYTYWDNAHPTAAAHLYLARSFAEFLSTSNILQGASMQSIAASSTTPSPP